MDRQKFHHFRNRLGKTQREMSELLGTSLKSVHAYEQGWRNIPAAVERQLLFLVSRKTEKSRDLQSCWEVKRCPPEQRENCPAWEFGAGTLCWFINGTRCEGAALPDWKAKMDVCRRCGVFRKVFPGP